MRHGPGQVNMELAVRNGRMRKTLDIPVKYVPALAAAAERDNRDLKSFLEKILIDYSMSCGAPEKPVHETVSTTLLADKLPKEKATNGSTKGNNKFLEQRRNAKNSVK